MRLSGMAFPVKHAVRMGRFSGELAPAPGRRTKPHALICPIGKFGLLTYCDSGVTAITGSRRKPLTRTVELLIGSVYVTVLVKRLEKSPASSLIDGIVWRFAAPKRWMDF